MSIIQTLSSNNALLKNLTNKIDNLISTPEVKTCSLHDLTNGNYDTLLCTRLINNEIVDYYGNGESNIDNIVCGTMIYVEGESFLPKLNYDITNANNLKYHNTSDISTGSYAYGFWLTPNENGAIMELS